MRRIILLFLAAALFATPAAAQLHRGHILGQWCGIPAPTRPDPSNYFFTDNSLTVTWHRDGAQRQFIVLRYEVGNDTIRVHWIREGVETVVVFGMFSPDRRTMFDLSSRTGIPLEFRRC